MHGSSEQSKTPTKFMDWLASHRDDIENGVASFEGVRVKRDSEVARYFCCCSFLFFVVRQMSGIVLVGSGEATRTRLMSTIFTLIMGCFGIGIFMVPFYLFKNIVGGDRLTVADVLDNSPKLQKGIEGFEFGPGVMIISTVGILLLACWGLQLLIYLKKHTGH